MSTEKDDDVVVNVRLPRDWLARADTVMTVLEKNEQARAYGRVSRAMVIRLAVLRGLEVLEKEHLPRVARTYEWKGEQKTAAELASLSDHSVAYVEDILRDHEQGAHVDAWLLSKRVKDPEQHTEARSSLRKKLPRKAQPKGEPLKRR